MTTLVEALQLFNRAEPDLLLRDAFDTPECPLVMSRGFIERVCNKLGLEPFKPDFWAFEYTFNALAGALYLYVVGEPNPARAWTPRDLPVRANPKQEDRISRTGQQNRNTVRHLVEGNREDYDLIIVKGNTIILIEAKIYSKNNVSQVSSKKLRLDLLKKFYMDLPKWHEKPVTFCPLLATRSGSDRDMRLHVPRERVYRTERCDALGKKNKAGDYIHIVAGQ